MRLVVFGTGPFAVPTFQSLLNSAHKVLALVTRPIDDPGQRRKTAANPMRDLAQNVGLRIFDPPDVNELSFGSQLAEKAADLFVVCDYGQILSDRCLAAARLSGINLHGSLLPKYRGAAPIHWAIYKGERVTGVTVIRMTGKLDGGPILSQRQLEIEAFDTTETLEPRLARLGVSTVHEALGQLEKWDGVQPIGFLQNSELATRARRLRKEDGLIRWSRTAQQIVNQVRAFQPWPGTYTNWFRGENAAVRLIVVRASIRDLELPTVEIGSVAFVDKNSMIVRTGSAGLALDMVQPSGKKPMPIDAFLRGNQVQIGDRLG